jgi:thioredoxin-like negative regulator of GroEL
MSKKILRFTASWCGPCKSLAQNLEIANLGLPIEVIDIDVHDDVANDFGIRSVPTLVMMQDNIEVKRLVGSKAVNQLKEWAND